MPGVRKPMQVAQGTVATTIQAIPRAAIVHRFRQTSLPPMQDPSDQNGRDDGDESEHRQQLFKLPFTLRIEVLHVGGGKQRECDRRGADGPKSAHCHQDHKLNHNTRRNLCDRYRGEASRLVFGPFAHPVFNSKCLLKSLRLQTSQPNPAGLAILCDRRSLQTTPRPLWLV